jgi:hypothetical protein
MNEIATATATAEWKAGYRAEALAVLTECGATTGELREFLTGLGFGTAVAWSLVTKFGAAA